MHTLSSKINEVETMIFKKIQHPYVEKFIKQPFIDKDKLLILHYLYEDVSIKDEEKQRYMTTIMLVHMALDTHETIPADLETPMHETVKQLTVLAGDFYSGLYYYLLAEMEDISMIRTLAIAIEQINEAKMKLYHNECSTIDMFIQTIEQIETSVLDEVANVLQVDKDIYSIWKQFIILNRLVKESNKITSNSNSYVQQFIASIPVEKSIEWEIEMAIEKRKQMIDNGLLQMPYKYTALNNYIRETLNISMNTTAVEEG